MHSTAQRAMHKKKRRREKGEGGIAPARHRADTNASEGRGGGGKVHVKSGLDAGVKYGSNPAI